MPPRAVGPAPVVESEQLISRDEVTATLFAIADINLKLSRLIDLLEGGNDGEEWPPEDHT